MRDDPTHSLVEASEKRASARSRGPAPMPRVVIENVTPQISCGRYPVKRIVGDTCYAGADIYKDGHDLIAARLLARRPNERSWRIAPLRYDFDTDRWYGSFPLDRIGRWLFTVEAWTDVFGTWRQGVEKKVEAGQEVASELLEGAQIVREAAARASGAGRSALAEAADALSDESLGVQVRLRTARHDELKEVMSAHFDPDLVTRYDRVLPVRVDRKRALFAAWYEMFPRSQGPAPGVHGTFRTAEEQLPRIADLGFDVVYLPPIHPIGHTNRKGKNNALKTAPDDPGSPWAIGSEEGGHTAVEPTLGTLRDFEHFVRRANELGLEVALDYALQCSPDHPWTQVHPDWFFRRPDGTIHYAENPPKKYEDIYPIDFWCEDRDTLWNACKEILLFWIERGVKAFRVDNPHTKPFAFWEWVIEEVQREHPDVTFLAEAFTRPKRMRGLARIGFTQSYTYFTWRNIAAELREYMTELTRTEMAEYYRPNFFTNTPDILTEYLQEGGRPAFRIRLLLAATLSPLYGIYGGFELCENEPREPGSEEYASSEKYEIRWREFDAPGNLNADIEAINRIRHEHPSLQQLWNLRFETAENEDVLFYRKWADGPDPDHLLVVVTTDAHTVQESMIHVPLIDLGLPTDGPYEVEDLLTGDRYTWRGARNYVRLDPADGVGHIFRIVPRATPGATAEEADASGDEAAG